MLKLEEAQTIFWAAVNADGTTARRSGRPGAPNLGVKRDSEGVYTVLLPRPAHDAVVIVTPVHAIGGEGTPSVANAGSRVGLPDQIEVKTFAWSAGPDQFREGPLHDTPFKIMIITAPDLTAGEQRRVGTPLRLEESQTLFWGSVNADGSVGRFSGNENEKNFVVRHDSRGRYRIILDNPAHDAIVLATPVHTLGGNARPTIVNAGTRAGLPNEIEVTTFEHDPGSAVGNVNFRRPEVQDAPFKFIVITAPQLEEGENPGRVHPLRLEEAVTFFWGSVNANGALARSSGQPGAKNMSVAAHGGGEYTVHLAAAAHDAVIVATPVHAIGGASRPSAVTAGTPAGKPDQIAVETFNNGLRQETPFKFVIITAPNLPPRRAGIRPAG
jgi:hypothetical protein